MRSRSALLVLMLAVCAAATATADEIAVSYTTGGVKLVNDIPVGANCCASIEAPEYDMFIPEQDPGQNGSELRLTYMPWERLGFSIASREFEDVTTNEEIREPGGAPLSGTLTSFALELRQPLGAGFEITGRVSVVQWDVEEPNSFGTQVASGGGSEVDIGLNFRIVEALALQLQYSDLHSSTPFERGIWLGVQGSFVFGGSR